MGQPYEGLKRNPRVAGVPLAAAPGANLESDDVEHLLKASNDNSAARHGGRSVSSQLGRRRSTLFNALQRLSSAQAEPKVCSLSQVLKVSACVRSRARSSS